MDQLSVFTYAVDRVTEAGLTAMLRPRPELHVLDGNEIDRADVAIVAVDSVDEAALRTVKAIQRNGCPKVVMVVAHLDDTAVLSGVEAGACGFVARKDATPERVVEVVRAAARGEGCVPPHLLGSLLRQVSQLHNQVLAPQGIGLSGLSEREVEVLRLVAAGHDTAEIGRILSYSERTVKAVIHDVTTRLSLRNRSHAVAYAVRNGLI